MTQDELTSQNELTTQNIDRHRKAYSTPQLKGYSTPKLNKLGALGDTEHGESLGTDYAHTGGQS